MRKAILTREQIAAIYQKMQEQVRKGLQLAVEQFLTVGLAYELCLEKREIVALRLGDIDLEKNKIAVQRKNDRPDILTIPASLRPIIEAWLALRRLFPSDDLPGQPLLIVGDMHSLASKAVRFSGAPCAHEGLSTLRDTGIAHRVEDGMDIGRLTDFLGYARYASVERFVLRLQREGFVRAMAA